MKRTKIIATLGPASSEPGLLEELIKAGVDITRLNLSHGTRAEQARQIKLVRQTATRLGKPVGILADLQGPKIRTGSLVGEPWLLTTGAELVLTVDPAQNNRPNLVFVDYPPLPTQLQAGMKIFLADGMIGLTVVEVGPSQVRCRVDCDGELYSHKGVSLPGVAVTLPGLMPQDWVDLEFVVEAGVDLIAVSFARQAQHLVQIREWLQQRQATPLLIAKIENQEGLANSAAILEVCDGIMVARGDLGIELPPEELPLVQKELITLCNNAGKPVITATEMLESMIRNPRATRAEVTDVANAILDGTDAVMLSAETAIGKYPVAAVEVIVKVAQRIEAALKYEEILARKKVGLAPSIGDAISHATCQTALDLKVAAIITSTQSGSTARMVSKYRPAAPVIAVTPSPQVARQLTLSWGVYPLVVALAPNIEAMFDISMAAAKASGFINPNDLVVLTAGVRTGITGSTNLLQVLTVD